MAAARILTTVGAACLLAACDSLSQGGSRAEMEWAKAALERNGALEIVATDQQSGAFTVRVKDTGELHVVKASELVAALPNVPTTSAASEAASAQPATESPQPSEPVQPPAADASAEPAPAPETPVSSVAQSTPPASAVSAGEAATTDTQPMGAVIRSGPGYTVARAAPADPGEPAPAARAASSVGPTTAAVERRYEPIICQGARLLHIDNRNLEFEGDAVTAEDGCEIHITNSRISARGLGIAARSASVHIKNSSIEGESGSIEASEGAQVYAQSSSFRGLQRRLDSAVFHDLGGNVWN